MVRPPNIRHSKARRDPVTIDLDPADVKRGADAAETAGAGARTRQAGSKTETKAGSAATAATPDPAPTQQEAAMTRSASEATPDASAAASSATAAKPAAEPGSDAPKPSAAASGPTEPPARSTATSGTKPVFGRDAAGSSSGSASSSTGPSGATPPPPSRPAAGPAAASGATDAPAPRRGSLSLVAAGLVGGLVVLVGAGALQYADVLPSPGSSAEPGEPAGLAELRTELAALRDQVAAGGAGSQADPAQTARLDEVAGTVDQLRADIADLRSAISQGEGGDAAGLQALDQRLAELESTVATLGQASGEGGGDPVDLAPLTERIGAVESRIAEVSRAAEAASEASAGLPGRIAALDERLTALDGRVTELAGELEEQASNPRIALAIAAAGLKAAIDRGDPFMTELETYASIAPDAPEIADLRDLAASGVPTRAAISQEVNAAASRMIAAAAPSGDDTGFFGRLLDSMQSVVKVRPIGDVEGDDVGAIVARLEAAVRVGDYDRAVSEYENLPEPAQQAGADFIADVKARQTADALVERALSGALRPQEG
jgi:hypothetical protein